MSAPQASIVVPTFNRTWGLEAAIRSALSQSETSLELIVIDDASDESPEPIVRRCGDSRVRFFRQPTHAGMVANWGAGLAQARGEFVTFVGDDDLLAPDFVANRLRQFAAHPDVTVVFSDYEQRAPDGQLVGVVTSGALAPRLLAPLELLRAALAKRWFIGAALYRREAVAARWPTVLHDDLVLDYSLNLQLALAGARGVALPTRDFIMGVHPGQNSRAKRHDVFGQADALMRRLLTQPMPRDMRRAVRRELSSWIVTFGRICAAEGQDTLARHAFRRAIGADPAHVSAWRFLVESLICPACLAKTARRAGLASA